MLRGRPTDGPLKNAPFNTYILLNAFSTYSSGWSSVLPGDDRVPRVEKLKIVLGAT